MNGQNNRAIDHNAVYKKEKQRRKKGEQTMHIPSSLLHLLNHNRTPNYFDDNLLKLHIGILNSIG